MLNLLDHLYALAQQNKGRLLAAGPTHKDVEYVPGGHARHKLDIYLPPRSGRQPLTLIVWIHGGAWRAGSKKDCPAKPFVSKGYAVASINYRLSQHVLLC